MKKSILASSIAAAVFGLGATGVAQAAVNGLEGGHVLFVPYYSAQEANNTLLSLVNTDTANGKAVKVRFRGAANSDDVFDFQVFLSPGDVWTANISKGANGAAQLTTTDSSCTKPTASVLNATPFLTNRLDQALTGDALMNGTREGYVEILNMADIPKANQTAGGAGVATSTTNLDNALYTAVKHVKDANGKSVAPCSGTAWTALDKTAPVVTDAAGLPLGMLPPSGGLMANWTIINTVGAAAWTGSAQQLDLTDLTTKVTYFAQTAATVTDIQKFTADPLLIPVAKRVNVENGGTELTNTTGGAAVTAGSYDLPDLSTPLTTKAALSTPAAQAAIYSLALSKTSIRNEFLTDSAIGATTDWVFSMPTRRYAVAMAYSKISATDDGRRFNGDNAAQFNLDTTGLVNKQICVKGVTVTPFDREENSPTSSTEVVISPSTPTAGDLFCGEASVLSFNNGTQTTSGSLKANVALKNVEVGYNAGWAKITMPSLPVMGASFVRALGNNTQTFGATYSHR